MIFFLIMSAVEGQEDHPRHGGVSGRPYSGTYQRPEQPNDKDEHPQNTRAEPAKKDNVFVWDGFEDDMPQAGWSTDSSADPAQLKVSDARKSEGTAALHVEPQFAQKKRVLVRRAGTVNFQGLSSVLIDVFSSTDALRCALAYKDTGGGWHQSSLKSLEQGWNKNLRWSIDDLTTRRSTSGYYGSDMKAQEFYVVLHDDDSSAPEVTVDNLRFEGSPTGDWNTRPPDSLDVFQPTRSIGVYDKFEVGIQFKGIYGSLFDEEDTLVEAVFTSPDGQQKTIRGFLAGYADHQRFGDDWPIFLVRFTPKTVGRWTFQIRVSNPKGTTTGCKRWFYVSDSLRRGFVGIAPDNPEYFAFDNGDLYYPIGQNVAWAQNYTEYFKRMEATGQNWARIWICPWHLQLEKTPGRYNLDHAKRLDTIVEQARQHGIYVQLVLIYHGMLNGESWDKNPYNWDNDGPCYLASEFFTNQRAKELFQQRLNYIVARWGYATNIFAWELFNEVDLTRYNRFKDVVQWHREMSDYLKKIDVNNHLVTTSLSEKNDIPELWKLPQIDFMPLHIYTRDITGFLLDQFRELRSFRKPWFIAEYALSTDMAEVKKDTEGDSLRSALWAATMLPMGGNVMSWWWDSYIKPHELDKLYSPVARFNASINRRKENYRIVDSTLLQDNGPEIGIRGMMNNVNCYLWLHPHQEEPSNNSSQWFIQKDQTIAVTGLLAGKYDARVINTTSGEVLLETETSPKSGKLSLSLPKCDSSVAISIEYKGNPEPEIRLESGPSKIK